MLCMVEPSFIAMKTAFLLPLLVRTHPLTTISSLKDANASQALIFILFVFLSKPILHNSFFTETKEAINKETAMSIMLENPAIIKRPILNNGKALELGFSEATYQQLFTSS